MASNYTVNLRFDKQGTGDNVNAWGDRLNYALDRIDDSIAGFLTLTIPASGNYTLASATSNTSADEARMAHLKLTGSPAATFSLVIPSVSKQYWIWNATAYAVTVTTGSGSTVTVDAGDTMPVWCDGTNVTTITYGGYTLKNYIAAQVLSGSASYPSIVGNAGKYLYTDGSSALWRAIATTDMSDYQTAIKGLQVALAVAL